MTKQSKPGDRWQQVFAAVATRPQRWCKGCGYHPVVNGGVHRADCTLSRHDMAVRLAAGLLGGRIVDDRIPGAR